jgi:hypothetical protein
MDANGWVKPVNYELKHAEAGKDSPLYCPFIVVRFKPKPKLDCQFRLF